MKGFPLTFLLAASLSASAAPRPADGRLAYVQHAGTGCTVGVWDSKSRTSRVLGSLPECPKTVSVTSREQALVLIFDFNIRLVDINSGKIGDAILMPAEGTTKTLDTERSLAGYTSDGALALDLMDDQPDSSVISRVFLFKGGAWTKATERPCDRFDACAPQPAIEAHQLDDVYGVGPDGLINEDLARDPYVTKRSTKEMSPDHGGEGRTKITMTFHVDSHDTQLVFDAVPGEDRDGTYTFGLKLILPGGKALTINDYDQYGATLVGHYLFYRGFFDAGVRLYDVGNGEVVLDKLVTGGWLEPAP